MRFEDALRLAGLKPRSNDVVADGRVHRCATEDKPKHRNGWFILFPDGRRGVYGNNAIAPRQALGEWKDDTATPRDATPQERARQERLRADERQRRIESMRSARRFWEASRPLNQPHPYIAAKGLSPLGCSGLRMRDGMLVIPVMCEQWLISLQTISPTGEKRFWPGAPVKAGAFLINRHGASVTVLCEGLATGLAIYQSMRSARVIVCFDCGNLVSVVERLKPRGSVVFAADNDWRTAAKPHMHGANPGIDKAKNAAELIGAGVTWPMDISGSDFADLLKEHGQPAARRIERQILAAARYITKETT